MSEQREDENEISPEVLAEEVRKLAAFAATGASHDKLRYDVRTIVTAVQDIAEAATARLALLRDRPVKPKQLAALAKVNTERLRQLPRTAEGYIAPGAARELLAASGVPAVAPRRFDVTPSWWQSTLPGDRSRRAVEDLVRRTLPRGATIDEQLTTISIVMPGGAVTDDDELRAHAERTRAAVEKLGR